MAIDVQYTYLIVIFTDDSPPNTFKLKTHINVF